MIPSVRDDDNPEVQAALEQEADELLSRHVTLGAPSGIYSEVQLGRKMRDQSARYPTVAGVGIPAEMIDLLLEMRVEELIDAANLTAIEEVTYRLHVSGLNFRGMASAMGIRFGLLERRLRTVKRKIKAAHMQGRYAGWYEVYLSEVNRPAYRRRR